MTLLHYLRNLQTIMRGFEELPNDNPHIQRFYAKDIDCPPVWRDRLSEHLPKGTFYLAPEAELMSSLPPAARAENMKCYRGGTFTQAHKEMCASLGHNSMVAISGEGQDAGSSIWFMTRSSIHTAGRRRYSSPQEAQYAMQYGSDHEEPVES
jgi:hypothetical protein